MSEIKRGIVYVGFGENFVKELAFSAESVKRYNPGLHITAFVDKPNDCKYVDDWKIIVPRHRRPKIDNLSKTPYEQTMFLDTDTIVQYNISDMFDILENFDYAACHDLARKRVKYSRVIKPYGEIPYSFSELNTGVMVFKKNQRVLDLFDLWKTNFYKYYKHCPWDQPTFRISLWESIKNGLKFHTFPVEYNIRSKANREKQRKFHHEFGEEHLTPRIFHMHVDDINNGKYGVESLEDVVEYCKKNFMEY
tara:strand:- start:2510 stop:3259 length:750 start_codon:yes stop_codon:yes gene_type:complete